MPVKVIFRCSGCWEAEAEGTDYLRQRFDSFNGCGYGFGTYRYEDARAVVPDGWTAYDPYTGCTYCPECTKSLFEENSCEENMRDLPLLDT